ncbi:zinc C3HC4 type (RING finger) domain containing [Brachionus plicatilis]|uniref:Zinc C3HC4 type (RING finger) domain containing n=1 Tax=Brachionus plicatilis TaxID=10195 RepID=A0A3M7QIZ7_BRAPC|nr:zinc C3HC4 type (RING finger) domain containing [Brachionus plicatilis]
MTEFSTNLIEIDKTFNKIFDQFQCPICFDEFKKTFMTLKCCHRFCEMCIKKTIKQHGKCPLCNKYLTDQDLVRDNHFDSLLEEFKNLKEKKIQSVFENLSDNQVNIDKKFSSIQSVFKSIFLQNILNSNYEKEVARIKEMTEQEISTTENSTKIEKVKQECQKKIEKLAEEFDHQIKSIAKRYQMLLEENEKSLIILPTKIKFRLYEKNIKLDGFEFKPTDDISMMFNYLKEESKKQLHDPIIKFPDDLIILNFGPFSTHSNDEMIAIFEEYKKKGILPEPIEKIRAENCLPVTEYKIKPNSEFVLFGNIKFESDLPKRCFKYIFDKNKPKPIDYFQCEDCLLKWICKFCIEECHKKHNVRPFSLNHNANWACCFCERNNCCLKESSEMNIEF